MDEPGGGDLGEQLVLADLVNRVLDRGVTVAGSVLISVAGVDLIFLNLRLDLAAVETAAKYGMTRMRGTGRKLPSSGERG
jgi:hypothetical protein